VTFRRLSAAVILAACAIVCFTIADALAQQTGPFGAPRPPSIPQADGIVGWILAKQAEFYRSFSGLIRAAKSDGSAVWTLLGLSFLYGIFHAAGPGHGKAVISSYMVASGETWRRGVVLSFVSALAQALVAIAVVSIAAGLIGVTRRTMDVTVQWIEIASYAMIAVLGLSLTWTKGRGFIAAWRGQEHAHGHTHSHSHAHDHDHHHHHEGHHHHGTHDHKHHSHDDHHGHSHGPEPEELAGPGGWKRGLSAIVAVGLRPCSGAILVLVFALAQGLYWAGVAATFMIGLGTAITVAAIATLAITAKNLAARFSSGGEGRGALLIRGVELAAALLVLVFGVALLTGYMTSERLL